MSQRFALTLLVTRCHVSTRMQVLNLGSTVTHASGDSRFRMPLPGPPGLPGWSVSRSGVTRTSPTDPTRRWQGMKRGLATLHFRVHKGVYVPTPEEAALMKLPELQKPQAARIQEHAAQQKLQQMILETISGGNDAPASPLAPFGTSLWSKSARRSAALLEKNGGLILQGQLEATEGGRRKSYRLGQGREHSSDEEFTL
jgi:hypothetical protein